MLMFIVVMLVIGLVAGALARAVVPGDDSMSVGGTILLGIVGSFVGGFLGWALFGADAGEGALQASGLLGSFLGAVVALLLWRASNRGSLRV